MSGRARRARRTWPPPLRKANVLARIHLEVEIQGILYVRLDHFLHEFHKNGVFAKDMRVKLIGVSDKTRKSESVARAREHRRRLIATALLHTGEMVHRRCGRCTKMQTRRTRPVCILSKGR